MKNKTLWILVTGLVLLLFLWFFINQKTKKGVVIPPPKTLKQNQYGKMTLKELQGSKNNAFYSFDSLLKEGEKLPQGIVVKWLYRSPSTFPLLKKEDMVMIDYRLVLPDGKIIDGNRDTPFAPFLVGLNMQTKGWDIAFQSLRVGDIAKIEIPASYAYGSVGLPGIIPANSTNWLYVKVICKVNPWFSQDGLKVWSIKKGEEATLNSEKKDILYDAIITSDRQGSIENSLQTKIPYRYVTGQKNVIKGLELVLQRAKKGQKLMALIGPNLAYGSKGYGKIIGPNETLFYNISIRDLR